MLGLDLFFEAYFFIVEVNTAIFKQDVSVHILYCAEDLHNSHVDTIFVHLRDDRVPVLELDRALAVG